MHEIGARILEPEAGFEGGGFLEEGEGSTAGRESSF